MCFSDHSDNESLTGGRQRFDHWLVAISKLIYCERGLNSANSFSALAISLPTSFALMRVALLCEPVF
jgi:hypothetical protein